MQFIYAASMLYTQQYSQKLTIPTCIDPHFPTNYHLLIGHLEIDLSQIKWGKTELSITYKNFTNFAKLLSITPCKPDNFRKWGDQCWHCVRYVYQNLHKEASLWPYNLHDECFINQIRTLKPDFDIFSARGCFITSTGVFLSVFITRIRWNRSFPR